MFITVDDIDVDVVVLLVDCLSCFAIICDSLCLLFDCFVLIICDSLCLLLLLPFVMFIIYVHVII